MPFNIINTFIIFLSIEKKQTKEQKAVEVKQKNNTIVYLGFLPNRFSTRDSKRMFRFCSEK